MEVKFLDESVYLTESIEDSPKKFMIVNWQYVADTINKYLKTKGYEGVVKLNHGDSVFGDLTRLAVLDNQARTRYMIGTNKAGTQFLLAPKGGSTKIYKTLRELADYLVDHSESVTLSF